MDDIFIKHRKRGVSMSKISLLEDDLSLINGLSFLAAVHAPSKRMRNMAVTETINEL